MKPELVAFPEGLKLDSGQSLPEFQLAYHRWGELADDGSNAILLCHTMTSDARAGGEAAPGQRPGWWSRAVGPGRLFDTNRYCVVCSNVLGGCGGSTGPSSPHPEDGRPYGLRFPQVSIQDMVRAQRMLQLHLGIPCWHLVAGGCMGGFQALSWSVHFPEAVKNVMAIGCSARSSSLSLAFFEVLRQSIYLDPGWREGDHYGHDRCWRGMALNAMVGTLFWMTPEVMEQRFARQRVAAAESGGFSREPQQLSQGAYGQNFDPNTILYTSRACSDFDLHPQDQPLEEVFAEARARYLLVSYANDLRYPAEQLEQLGQALRKAGHQASHHVLSSPLGHGAFLYEPELLLPLLRDFLAD